MGRLSFWVLLTSGGATKVSCEATREHTLSFWVLLMSSEAAKAKGEAVRARPKRRADALLSVASLLPYAAPPLMSETLK